MAKTNGKKRMTTRDWQRARIASAMPEVKKLVKRFGRPAIGNCLAKIAEYEREQKKLSKLRSEVAQLERRIRA